MNGSLLGEDLTNFTNHGGSVRSLALGSFGMLDTFYLRRFWYTWCGNPSDSANLKRRKRYWLAFFFFAAILWSALQIYRCPQSFQLIFYSMYFVFLSASGKPALKILREAFYPISPHHWLSGLDNSNLLQPVVEPNNSICLPF